MQPAGDPTHALARRLRALRQKHWSGRRITQPQLAAALGVSAPLVSGWESATNPRVPPLDRLAAYATFFATERSLDGEPFRLLDPDRLSGDECERHDALLRELTDLREAALGEETDLVSAPDSLLYFPDGFDVTIVCTELPKDLRTMEYADPASPDYAQLYTLGDPDALLELHGHIRALNPANQVNIRLSRDMRRDDLTTHLVLLGGVDWNVVTRDLLGRLKMPVEQGRRDDGSSETGMLRAKVRGTWQEFVPIVHAFDTRRVLVEDVAHIYRSANPYNVRRTVTLFNGMFGRGTYGAVRALTDAKFRELNEAYVRERFANSNQFSVITRVVIATGQVVTPDWEVPENLLHEWPEG